MSHFDMIADNRIFAGRKLPAINWDSVADGPESVDDFIFRHAESDAEIDAEPLTVEPVDDLFGIRQKRVARMAAIMPDNERDQESFLISLSKLDQELTDFA